MTRSALEVVNAYLDGIKAKDVNAIMATLADDCQFYTPCVPPPTPKLLSGIDQIRPVFVYLFETAFQEFRFDRLDVYETSDPTFVAVHAHSNVTLAGNKPYSNDYAYFGRVRDGLIVEFWEFFDTTRASVAMSV